ncbi:hypothetical protein DPEC_G00105570 [Dallia pectoralis]|uniref:Uncharacterized protein n=1 Tax=Dallia pectoralis TaxID=75939 RepID=A0ACC2GXJ4_DALPE|nr:hypothetical protein DPEC_G00105570 [Dallia pectoralis]
MVKPKVSSDSPWCCVTVTMATLTVLLLVSVVSALVDADKHKCPKKWFGFESKCFLIDKTSRTWRDAEHNCVSLGEILESEHQSNSYSGHLASVHSPEEFQYLQALTQAVRLPLWIGGSARAGQWSWVDGSKFNYKNWAKGKPENFDPERKSCIQMNYGEKQRWNDETCVKKFPSLCSLRTE